MDTAHVKLDHAQTNGQHDEGHGNAHTLGAGVEELLHPVEEPAHSRAQSQRQNDLHDGLQHHGDHVDVTGGQGGGNAEGDAEQHQTHGVVNGDHQHQQAGQGAVGLVLPNDHQGGGGGRCGGDGTQRDGAGNGDQAGEQQVQRDQGNVHEHCGNDGLQNTDGDGFCAGGLQLAQAELIAHGEGDKAQRGLGNDLHAVHLFGGIEAQTGYLQRADAEGAEKQAGNQISGDGGELDQLGHTGKHQTADQSDGKRNQRNFHVQNLVSFR